MTATAANYEPPGYYFVPPGHARIIPFRVLAGWKHKESGAWLSIQCLGPAMALVWRASDDFAATPMLAREVCESLDRDANFRRALILVDYELFDGPPAGLIESARKSAEVRSERARKAANARYAKNGSATTETPTNAKPRPANVDLSKDLEKGPKHDKAKWNWGKVATGSDLGSPMWSLTQHCVKDGQDSHYFEVVCDRYGYCDLQRTWWRGDTPFEDRPIRNIPLKECFEKIEKLCSIPLSDWRQGQLV